MISILMDQMTSTRFGIDCQDCQIRHKAICANSDADELAQLNSFKTYTRYQPNEMITYSGDPMDYVGTLVTGMAEISMALEDGRRQILGLLMPGDFIGRPDRLYCKYDIKALERLASIDTVVFDKTGTLSTDQFQARLPAEFSPKDRACLKALAAMSHHPYAKAIVDALDQTESNSIPLENAEEVPSKGMKAKFKGDVVKLGRPEWVDPDLAIPPDFSGIAFHIGQDKTWLFPMGESLRPGMKAMMTALDDLGYQRALLTGDHAQPAQILAQDLGFDHIESHMTPEGKTQYLDGLEAQGHQVMMVGDGLNDAAAMSGERLSLAPQSAMDAARASADIILLNGRLDILPDVLKLSKVARLRMLQNFGLAALYNIITIPLAFSGFATPLMAALAMSLSSITVTLNAFRLPKINKGNAPDLFQPQQERAP